MASGIVVKEIKNWREFHKVVAGPKYQNWAFRGHSDAEWPLCSSLSRYLKGYGIRREAWANRAEAVDAFFGMGEIAYELFDLGAAAAAFHHPQRQPARAAFS